MDIITMKTTPNPEEETDSDNAYPCEICGKLEDCGCDAECCGNCDGEGYTDEDFQEECEECEGTGQVPL